MDGLDDLIKFADNLEKATIQTIEEGVMTGDLAALSTLENKQKVDTEEFLLAVSYTHLEFIYCYAEYCLH